MKGLCFRVLTLCALVVGDVSFGNEVPSVNYHGGPYSQQFVFLKGNPDYEPSVLESILGRSLIASVIETALNDFRDVVINGSDNLPPLDPFKIDNIGPVEIAMTGVNVKASVSNFRAEGLQWYVVDYVTFNSIRLALGVHVTLPWLTFTGAYDSEVKFVSLLTQRAGGNFRVFINRFEAGVDVRLGTNLLGGHLVLRELDIKLDIHDTFINIDGMTGSAMINSIISAFVQDLSQDVIQSQMANISQILSEELFESINDFLKDYTLADIMG